MGRTRKNCPVFGCGSSNLGRLSNHLAQVHNMDREERKKWLKWSKVGICVPLKDKDASKKDLHMANTLERPVNLQEEMAANFKKRSIIGSIILFRQKWCKFTHLKKNAQK